MAKKRVADLLVDTLVAADVKRVYGLVGDFLNCVTDRRKIFLVPSPEFHASMIFPEQALWQD